MSTPSAGAQDRDWDALERERYRACLAKVESNPEEAYEDGLIWRGEGGGVPARHCVATAMLALGQTAEAAARLESAALAPDGGDPIQRTEILHQAGEAWLLAERFSDAENAFTQGLVYTPGDTSLLTNRAQARWEQDRYRDAEADLSDVLLVSPGDVRALRMRADLRLEMGRLTEAQSDIDLAASLAPDDVETLVVRGRVREAIRLGAR